jgi:hypothetical protein
VFANDPDVRVMWDRRVGERRRAAAPPDVVDRRSGDRRRLSKPWSHLNYIVVNAAA